MKVVTTTNNKNNKSNNNNNNNFDSSRVWASLQIKKVKRESFHNVRVRDVTWYENRAEVELITW